MDKNNFKRQQSAVGGKSKKPLDQNNKLDLNDTENGEGLSPTSKASLNEEQENNNVDKIVTEAVATTEELNQQPYTDNVDGIPDNSQNNGNFICTRNYQDNGVNKPLLNELQNRKNESTFYGVRKSTIAKCAKALYHISLVVGVVGSYFYTWHSNQQNEIIGLHDHLVADHGVNDIGDTIFNNTNNGNNNTNNGNNNTNNADINNTLRYVGNGLTNLVNNLIGN